MGALRVGPGIDAGSDIGSLVSVAEHHEFLETKYVAAGI